MSNVQQLSTIFKLDLAKFISTDLDSSNFLQYSSVASEIIQALVSLNSDELQVSADKIISLCLPELFSNQSEQNDLLLLNYIRQSSSHCSAKTFNQLFITFLVQFTRLATSKGTTRNEFLNYFI